MGYDEGFNQAIFLVPESECRNNKICSGMPWIPKKKNGKANSLEAPPTAWTSLCAIAVYHHVVHN
jgi:hypothetical protein